MTDDTSVHRVFDAIEFNAIINHPDIVDSVRGDIAGPLDVTNVVADPRNILLMGEGGGVLFAQDEPGIYEVHTNFLPEYRGKHAIDVSLNAYRWMFLSTNCVLLQTKIPAFNRAAKLAARIVGFDLQFKRDKSWPTPNGLVDLAYYALPYSKWVKSADGLVEAGQRYHVRLDEEFARHGRKPHQHADDFAHDRYAGACAEMIYAGQPEKAVVLYNRWARFAGYGQIMLSSRNPIMIDIGEAVLLVGDRTFKVVKCR